MGLVSGSEWGRLRGVCAERNIRLKRLAQAADMDAGDLSHALHGDQTVGAARGQRLIEAARQLGLDREAPGSPAWQPPELKALAARRPRIRRL